MSDRGGDGRGGSNGGGDGCVGSDGVGDGDDGGDGGSGGGRSGWAVGPRNKKWPSMRLTLGKVQTITSLLGKRNVRPVDDLGGSSSLPAGSGSDKVQEKGVFFSK